MPERFPVFCRTSSMRLIRAARPPVVARFSLLHKDHKSLTYSLPISRSAGIGPGSANVEVFLARRVGGMLSTHAWFMRSKRHAECKINWPRGCSG